MPGSDTVFFVSGSRGSDVSVFGGDLIVSGGLSAQGDIVEITGSLIVTSGITGSLTKLSNGTSYLVAGANVTISSASNGSITISSTGGGGSSFFNSTTPNAIFTTGSAAFVGGDSGVDAPADKGADVFFYVSGTMGSKDTATKGVALFSGDVAISGTLHGGSPLKIGSDVQILNDGTTLFFSGSLVQSQGNIITGSHNVAFGRNNVAVNDYVNLFGDGNFTADIFSALISVDTGLNELTVADGTMFQLGDEVAYVYEVIDDATKIHRTTVTGISSNVLTVSSTVALDTTNYTMWVGLLQELGYNAGTESILFCLSRKVQTSTFSRSEGIYSIAIGSGSYARGYKSAATGSYSYAEGYQSVATGYASHAEGANFTRALGDVSHAEGDGTIASGYISHSEGAGTTASGDYSHAEGNSGIASGESSHAEGQTTVASGDRSHAEGWFAEATGIASHAEGNFTIASGDYSHAEGTGTRALGVGSHAGGLGTIASGSSQMAVGQFNLRDNDFSLFVVGNGTGDDSTDRSDVFRVNTSNVEVTGSLIVTGSLQVTGSFLAQGDLLEMTGTLSVTNGISGSLTKLADGTSYLVAGTNISITSQSNGSVLVTNTFAQIDDYFDSTTANSIFTTGSAAFRGGESAVDSPADKGTDVFFYVSGSVSGNGAEDKKTLFGGDVRISGSLLIGTGSVRITSNDVQFGSPALRIEKRGSDLSLSGNAQLTGSLYSAGNVAVTGFFAGAAQTFTTSPVSDGDSQHLSIFTPSTDPQLVTLEDGRSVGQLKYCVATNVSGEVRITPTSKIGSWSYVRLPKATLGSTAVFLWTGTAWAYFGGYGSSVV